MKNMRTWLIIAATATSLSALGCDDDDDDGNTFADAGTGAGAGTGTGTGDGGSSGSGVDGGTRSDAGRNGTSGDANDDAREDELTEPEIAQATTVANTGEVAQANAALPKLKNARAKEFANMMVKMHSAAQERQEAIAADHGVEPEPSDVSETLQAESDQVIAELSSASADAVDVLYIQGQVMVHTSVLAVMEDILIPSAEEADLKSELEKARDEVADHLSLAQDILDEIE